MVADKKKKVLIENLPKDWRELGAEKFSCSVSLIEKVVYGITKNIDLFDYMLSLAEAEKERITAKELEIESRLSKLAE